MYRIRQSKNRLSLLARKCPICAAGRFKREGGQKVSSVRCKGSSISLLIEFRMPHIRPLLHETDVKCNHSVYPTKEIPLGRCDNLARMEDMEGGPHFVFSSLLSSVSGFSSTDHGIDSASEQG